MTKEDELNQLVLFLILGPALLRLPLEKRNKVQIILLKLIHDVQFERYEGLKGLLKFLSADCFVFLALGLHKHEHDYFSSLTLRLYLPSLTIS